MKIIDYQGRLYTNDLHRILRTMKIMICFLLAGIGSIFSMTYSQSTELSLDIEKQTVREVFNIIETQTEYVFYFSDEVTSEMEKVVNVKVKKQTLDRILDNIFSGTDLTYTINDRQVSVTRSPERTMPGRTATKQSRRITGVVVDYDGIPVIGANVIEKGTTNGIITDIDGKFALNVNEGAALLISYIGYISQEVPVANNSMFTIRLAEDAKALDEVVVVGYGSVKKSDITGSVASVKVSELREGATSSVDQLLLGKSAGVNVVQNTGEPGGGFSINVRGATSVNAGNSPLYVIDGVPIDNSRGVDKADLVGFSDNRAPRNPMSSINPADIESIEILKDASATAIYGSRGANGVILITTKSGSKDEKTKVSYQGYVGVQTTASKLKLLNAQEYKQVLNAIIDAGGESEEYRVGDIANGGKGTDWQDEIMRNAMVQDHQISFTGGTQKTAYYVSLNYMSQEGTIKNTDFDRISARVNLRSEINSRLNIGMNVTGSYMKDAYVANGFGVNENAGATYSAINFDPTLGVQNEDGDYITSPFLNVDNPVAVTEGMRSNSETYRFLGSFFADFYILPELFVKVNLGTDFMNESRKSFVNSLTIQGRNEGGVATNQNAEKSNYLVEGTLNYNKSFGIHAINAVGGVTYQRFLTSRLMNKASDFANESLGADNLNVGSQETFRITNSSTGNRLASYIGRVNYSLMDKYLITATIRADGSSRFGRNNRFGYFPSAALGWKMSNENFLKDVDFLTSLKMRASWGRTGNQEIGDFPSLSTFEIGGTAIWGGSQAKGTRPSKLPNPDLKWETTEQTNIGFDFGFFNNRITGNIDYFMKKTTNMLMDLPVPQTTGYSTILSNVGRIDNKGVEFMLNTVNVDTRNFSWMSGFSITAMRNKVKDLGGQDDIIVGANYNHVTQVAIRRVGESLNAFYGWEIDGIWQEGDDYSKTKENFVPGDLKYVDQNGDGYIDDKDRVILGKSFPDFQWSFGNTFIYKNFDLYVFFEGVQGVDMLNGNLIDNYFPINFRRNKFAEPYLNRWTPENPGNEYPSFIDPLKFGRKVANSKTVQDASYVRLRTVRLTYTLPKLIPFVSGIQVYATGENLATFTSYLGLDPAVNADSKNNFRMDFNAYPTARSYIFGVKIDF